MLAIPQKSVPYGVQHFVICVDNFENGEISGNLYCGINQQSTPFSGLMPLLDLIDSIMDDLTPTQQFEQRRSLRRVMLPLGDMGDWRAAAAGNTGSCATFRLQVHFRQNATWQGELTWVEGKSAACFRSALEMIQAMHEVLQGSTARKAMAAQ